MITNASRIVSAIRNIEKEQSNANTNEVLTIGARFAPNQECFTIQTTRSLLLKSTWQFIDGKISGYKEKYPSTKFMTSIFIQDAAGALMFDSKEYTFGSDRIELRKNKDGRVSNFNNLSSEDKERLVEITAQQIESADIDTNKPPEEDIWKDILG